MNRDRPKGLRPGDWLLAETTRRQEESAGDFRLEDPATRAAAAAPVSTEERIVKRAGQLSDGAGMSADIDQTLGAMRWMTLLLMLLGLLAGAAASSGIQTAGSTIALSYALLVLLGVPLTLLLIWSVLNLWPGRRGAPGLPGRALWWLLRMFSRRFGLAPGRRHLAGALAELGRARGRTLMALATHAFWTLFFAGSIGWLWLRFLGLRFDFSWETTLLSGPWLEDLIIAIGWLPAWLFGLALPEPGQVQEVLGNRSSPADRGLWAGYLIGALTLYGLLPRALLALWYLRRWRRTRLMLDLARPGYLRLLPVLSGPSTATGPRGKPPPEQPAFRTQGPPASAGDGSPVLVGIELDIDETRWPPDIPGCRVLGRADNRRQRHQIQQALAMLEHTPEKIIALCSLARTPDRGTMTWLGELAQYAPVEIRLADADRLPVLGIDVGQRSQDWRRLAERYGLMLIHTDTDRSSPD